MLDGKNIAVLVGEDDAGCAVEIVEIIRAMKNMSARVRVVSSPGKRYLRTRRGSIRVDVAIDRARAADFDAIILCTDCRSANLEAHRHCTRLLLEAWKQGKLIAAIDKGQDLLEMAGILPVAVPAAAVAAGQPPKQPNLIIAQDSLKLMSFAKDIINSLSKQ